MDISSCKVSIYDLMTNDMADPVGIGDPKPVFSWKMKSDVIGQKQTAYQLVVKCVGETVWDSGKMESDISVGIVYAGDALQSSTEYTWSVTVWDKDGAAVVSREATFETALLEENAFADTMFISYREDCPTVGENENSVPAYRKSIYVKPGLVSAKLYTSGLGVYESYIKGRRVGRRLDDGSVQYYELKPGFTQRNLRQLYSSFDVTWMLTEGQENVLGGVVTSGWWLWVGRHYRGTETAYFAKLILSFKDGTQEIINTDTTWKSARFGAPARGLELTQYPAHYRYTGIYGGERYDATVDQSWMLPGYDDSGWGNAKQNTEFAGVVSPWVGVPVIVREDLELIPRTLTVYEGVTGADEENYGDVVIVDNYKDGDVISLKAGQTLIVNFGQNFAGWECLEFAGERGTVVTIEHGEWINEPGGNICRGNDGPGGSLYEASNRAATANTIYKMAGGGIEKYHPVFSYYGFQYMEIVATGDITIHKIRGQVVTSVHNDTATMETSDAAVNQLLSNARWGMLSNYVSIPTDCPQRNERHGWTGDAQTFSQAGTYLTFSKSFFANYLQVLRDSQATATGEDTGSYPDIAPLVSTFGTTSFGEVGWSDAGIIIPWNLYMMYGDKTLLEKHWDSMVAYMDYLATTDGNGPTNGALDHLSPEREGSSFAPLLGVAYYAWDALMMVDLANALGKKEAAAKYQAVYEQEKRIFQERYVNDDGTMNTWRQASYLFALFMELLPNQASVEAVIGQLEESLERHNYTMQTGFLSTAIITNTLTKVGRNDLAYLLLLQHDYPSWLYSVDQGATTVWERWDTYTAEMGWYDPTVSTMNSLNHYAYGAVVGWMYQTLAGIGYDKDNPGFKNIILDPAFDSRLPKIKSSYESVYGLIETQTKIERETITYTATIPANTTATFRIPVEKERTLMVNGKNPTALTMEHDGIEYVETLDDVAILNAVAGSFTFGICLGA